MLEHVKHKRISIEKVVEKMAHNPAILFRVQDRGFIREGYYADLVVVDPNKSQTINREGLLYKCGWSPFEGFTFSNTVNMTFINGRIAYKENRIIEGDFGMRLTFNRFVNG